MNRRTVKSILLVKKFLGLVEMTSGLVNASFSFPEWQAVKIFLAALFISFLPLLLVLFGSKNRLWLFLKLCQRSQNNTFSYTKLPLVMICLLRLKNIQGKFLPLWLSSAQLFITTSSLKKSCICPCSLLPEVLFCNK